MSEFHGPALPPDMIEAKEAEETKESKKGKRLPAGPTMPPDVDDEQEIRPPPPSVT